VFEQVAERLSWKTIVSPIPLLPVCEELLEKYREDERVMNIGARTGRAPLHGAPVATLLDFQHHLGWATWRRAWQYYDPAVRLWPEFRDTPWLLDLVRDARVAQMFAHAFDRAYTTQGELDFWDYQWTSLLGAPWPVDPSATTLVRTWGLGLRRRIRPR